MFLANVPINNKLLTLSLISGFLSFFIVVIGVSGFDAVYWSQIISGNGGGDWNREFLNNPTSPFMFLLVVAVFLLFKKLILSFNKKQMRYFIPVIMIDPEGPHIYHQYGKFWLLLAEGGTRSGHMVTMQIADNINGPYHSVINNPILTNRNYKNELQCVGHADIVQIDKERFCLVALATRQPPHIHRTLLGRETINYSYPF